MNPARDLRGQRLPVIGGQRETAFRRIRQESAFNQNRWDRSLSQNIETAAPNSAVLGRRAGNNVPMDTLGEARAVTPVVVGLDAVRPRPRRAVEMNGNKDRLRMGISDRDPSAERDENVAVAGHNYAIAARQEDAFEPLGDIQGFILLADSLSGHSTAIKPAMAGVNDDGSGLGKGGSAKCDQTGKSDKG